MRMRDRLAQLHGEAFDRAYMRAMVEDHDKALKAFSQEGLNGHDPEIKRFARDTLSVIKQHDRMARELDRSLTPVGSSGPPR
jgi:putative membrane protein